MVRRLAQRERWAAECKGAHVGADGVAACGEEAWRAGVMAVAVARVGGGERGRRVGSR